MVPTVRDQLADKVDKQRIAKRVAKDPALLDDLFDCMASDQATVRFGSEKVMRTLAENEPTVLYPRLDRLAAGLDSENKVLRWGAFFAIANLAGVDKRKRIDRLLDRYYEAIRGPALIAAANAVKGVAKIAAAKPYLVEDVVTRLLQVERRTYETEECKRVLLGQVIDALHGLFEHIGRKRRVLNFVTRQLVSPRPSTRKRAEKFLKRWATA